MINFLKDLIAPKKCYSCNEEWHFLCEKCLSKLSIFESICYYCKGKSDYYNVHLNCKKNVYYDKVIILSHYKNKYISKLIKDLKFYSRKDISEDLWKYLALLFFDNELYKNTDNYLILFPPMKFFKKLERWYNHSELLSKNISKITWIKIWKNIIKKIKNTKQQSILNRVDRLSNLNNCFFIKNNKEIIWKNIILVDDVISTWSTLNEISKELKKAWVNNIIWLIVASD